MAKANQREPGKSQRAQVTTSQVKSDSRTKFATSDAHFSTIHSPIHFQFDINVDVEVDINRKSISMHKQIHARTPPYVQ